MVSWKVKKQATISKSSAEVEYRSTEMYVSEGVWIKGLLQQLHIRGSFPAVLYCDNKAVIQIAGNLMFHERTKHIEIDCHFVREKMQDRVISLIHVSSKDQLADVLTKALLKQQHYSLLRGYGIVDYSVQGRHTENEEKFAEKSGG